MFSWMEVLCQWKHGIAYPRWAALAQWGYGEARFLFYPPASWNLGAALGAALPWKMVPGAYCWIVLTLAGASMYRLAREWLPAPDALFAAVFYALNPYHLLIVYWRSAYAELLAAPLLPLLLLCVLRLSDGEGREAGRFREGHDFSRAISQEKTPALAAEGNCTLLSYQSSRSTLWLSLLLAAAWLTNAPAAVMIYYSAAGLALVAAAIGAARETARMLAWNRGIGRPQIRTLVLRSLVLRTPVLRILVRTASAMLLGAGLAAFYLLPAIYEQGWINLTAVMSLGVRPQDNFLFTTIADPDHNRFNLLVSTIALAEIGVLALAIWFSRKNKHLGTAAPSTRSGRAPGCPIARSAAGAISNQSPWILLCAWGAACAALMLSVSNLLWQDSPELRFVQLPFRWLLCMNVALAMLLPMAAKRWSARLAASSVLLAVVILAGYRIQPPWWDQAADIREMSDSIADGTGYEGTDEYVPDGADPYELDKNLTLVSDDKGAPIPNRMLVWEPTEKHFIVHAAAPEKITMRLLSYPAWAVVVNGKPTATQKTEVTGLIVIPIAAGDNDVRIHFRRTSDRVAGTVVSLISLAAFVLAWIRTGRSGTEYPIVKSGESRHMTSRTVLVATSNPGKLRDFAGAAAPYGIMIANVPNFSSLPPVVEDGATFEENARKKADSYSLAVPGELLLADDSGLEIDALSGAPGVHSARYASDQPSTADCNADDEANNARVLRELIGVPEQKRTARFVCVLAVARDGQTLRTFRGAAEGVILDALRGQNGFGYDPLFYFPQINKTFAELSAEEKAQYSHRGAAFRAFLHWYR